MTKEGIEHYPPTIVTTTNGLNGLASEWDQLYIESNCQNPFARWGWTYQWWINFGEPQGEELKVITFRDKRNQLQAVVPLSQISHGLLNFKPFVAIKPVGRIKTGGIVMEIPPLLASPSSIQQIAESLPSVLSDSNVRFDWLDVQGVPTSVQSWRVDNSYLLLDLPDSWDKLRSNLSRNTNQSIRKSNHSIKADVMFEIVKDRTLIEGALNDFFRLHTARADSKNAVPHPNHFPTDTHKKFLRGVASSLGVEGFQVARLYVEDEVVAARVILQSSKNQLYLYSSGFDPDLSPFGVMNRLTIEIIKSAIDNPSINTINLSVGKDPNKTRWKPSEHFFGGFRYVSSPNMYRLANRWAAMRGRPV